MKTLILVIVAGGLLVTGCSTSTYFSLKDENRDSIKKQLNKVEKNENVGPEVSLLLSNGNEVKGELLSVRDTTIIICREIGLSETDLASTNHPTFYNIRNNEIKELTIEGGLYTWSGMGYGALGGALSGVALAAVTYEKSSYLSEGGAIIIVGGLGTIVGAITGGIIGYANSTDEIILSGIPTGYDFSELKPLTRYPGEEPEYLRAIK